MRTLETTNIPFQALPDIGHVASEYLTVGEFERRRRPLTIVFGLFAMTALFATGSAWPLHGVMRELFFFIGICMAAIGMLGRTWSNLFISGYKTRVLIQSGPYSICRNPLYFFSAIGMIGIGLCSETILLPLMMFLFFSLYYPWIISCEEKRLSAAHHEEYQEYCRRVPAFWPRLSTYEEPQSYTMIPRVMRKNIVDTFWFVALAAIVHIVADLHETHALPEFFTFW